MFIFIGIMAAIENTNKDDTSANTDTSQELPEDKETESITNTNTHVDHDVENTIETEVTATTISTENATETSTWNGPILKASDLSVNTLTDYAHTDTEVIFLGENEGVTISISAPTSEMTVDDLIIIYDYSLLKVKISEYSSNSNGTLIELYVTGKTACETEMAICTDYDVTTLGEKAPAFVFDIRKLNSTEGRVVYVTSSGTKYHFSQNCAGGYTTKTTRRDAMAYEYDPCGKCAN